MTFNIMSLSILKLSINDTQHSKNLQLLIVIMLIVINAECRYAECRYAECLGAIHNTSFYTELTNGPNKQQCLSLASLSSQVLCNA